MVVVGEAELGERGAFGQTADLLVLEEFRQFIDVVAFRTQEQELVEWDLVVGKQLEHQALPVLYVAFVVTDERLQQTQQVSGPQLRGDVPAYFHVLRISVLLFQFQSELLLPLDIVLSTRIQHVKFLFDSVDQIFVDMPTVGVQSSDYFFDGFARDNCCSFRISSAQLRQKEHCIGREMYVFLKRSHEWQVHYFVLILSIS